METPRQTPRATPGMDGGGPKQQQLNVSFSPDQREWLKKVADDLDESLAAAVRWTVERARTEKADKEIKPRQNRKTKFLAAIREKFYAELAASDSDVSQAEMEEWLGNDDFLLQVEHEQCIYRAELMEKLRKVGVGDIKGGNAIALIEILKAVAPEFGKVKMELVQRSWNKTLKEIFSILTAEFGDSQRDTLSSALQKIEDLFAHKLTNFAK